MKLRFDEQLVRQLLEDSKNASEHRSVLDDPESKHPGLWLVGDIGIYLMSNLKVGVKHPDSKEGQTKYLVAYASESNPEGGRSDWNKNRFDAFGGDDGVIFLSVEFMDSVLAHAKEGWIVLDVTPEGVGA